MFALLIRQVDEEAARLQVREILNCTLTPVSLV